MRLFLVRHGQTGANTRAELDTGDPGFPLTDLGWSQAEALPGAFEGVDIDLLMTSTLIRTHQTASHLARHRGLDPVIDKRVREIEAGDLEMNSDAESLQTYHQTVDDWSFGRLDGRMPGAESGHEVVHRFDSAIGDARSTLGDSGTLVVVAHGAIIRMWSRLRAQVSDPSQFPYIVNTEIVELAGQDESWEVVRRIAPRL